MKKVGIPRLHCVTPALTPRNLLRSGLIRLLLKQVRVPACCSRPSVQERATTGLPVSKRSSSQIEHAPWPVDEYRPAGQLTHVSVCCCSARYLPGSHAPHAYDCVDCQPRIGSPLTSVGPTFPTGQKRHCSPPIVPMEYAGQESVTHKHGDAIH